MIFFSLADSRLIKPKPPAERPPKITIYILYVIEIPLVLPCQKLFSLSQVIDVIVFQQYIIIIVFAKKDIEYV